MRAKRVFSPLRKSLGVALRRFLGFGVAATPLRWPPSFKKTVANTGKEHP